MKEVLEENFGGEQMNLAGINIRPNGRPMNRFTNAYMLVYIRESELDQVLAPVTEHDIPRHLAERIEDEVRIREQRRKEKEEQHLYMKTLIASDDTFKANTGFDFVNFEEKDAIENRLIVTRVRKDQLFGDFRQELAENIGLSSTDFRLWLMVNRQNRTVRIDMPIPDEENASTMDEVRQKYATNQATLRFYMERGDTFDEQGLAVFPSSTDGILIFIKHFQPEHQIIHGVGHLYVRKDAKVNSVLNALKEMIGYGEEEEISIYEEIKANMIDPVDFHYTFAQAELQDGDILCVQKKLTAEEENSVVSGGGLTKVDEFMNYELGKVLVGFAPLTPDESSPGLSLILHKEMGYEEMAARVAMELNVDPKKLRLINPYVQGSRAAPPKRFAGMKLGKLLQNAYTTGVAQKPRFYYEKLDVSLEEIESKCSVTVTVCTPTLKDLQIVDVLLPKDSGIADLLSALVAKGVQFQSQTGTRNVRIFNEIDGKFDKEFNDKLWREAVSTRPVVKVYAEEIPEEEADMDDNDVFIGVFHFQRTPNRTHSVPFKFVLKEVSFTFSYCTWSLFLTNEVSTNRMNH
jgi:ubiquitin carboxyl-terminal hydrolase 7